MPGQESGHAEGSTPLPQPEGGWLAHSTIWVIFSGCHKPVTLMLRPSHVFCLHCCLQIWTHNAPTNTAPAAAALVFTLSLRE